ncbi:MAG: hypothetical protein K2X50_01125 [Gammaproteobacteria bacterium]|nr:hypothetical protein [Gammaproteobacteria bacterium]
MLELVARKLGTLNNKVVYLGGCATALFINDPLSLDVRPTVDVDCIIDVISLGQYYKFENELSKVGFKKSMLDDVICRWHYDDIILDVMPAEEKILGFGNRWYKEALEYAITHQISDDLIIKSVAAPYFLATKIEAFQTRGNNDFLASHDFEDIITVIAGRVNIAEEVASSSAELKAHLKLTFSDILKDAQFEQALPGHISDGPITLQRVQTVMERINKIVMTKL